MPPRFNPPPGTVTAYYLQTAICPTQQAAQNFATNCPGGIGNVPFFSGMIQGHWTIFETFPATCDMTPLSLVDETPMSPISLKHGGDATRRCRRIRWFSDSGRLCTLFSSPVLRVLRSHRTGRVYRWRSKGRPRRNGNNDRPRRECARIGIRAAREDKCAGRSCRAQPS